MFELKVYHSSSITEENLFIQKYIEKAQRLPEDEEILKKIIVAATDMYLYTRNIQTFDRLQDFVKLYNEDKLFVKGEHIKKK